MADTFTGSNYYKRSLTEYEVEACKRDAAKQDKEDEVNAYERDQFYAAVAAKNEHEHDHTLAAKIERRAALDAEIQANVANDCSGMEWMNRLAVQTKRRAELDAEIPALEAEIVTAKTKRIDSLAAKYAEITALEAEIAAAKTKHADALAAKDAEITELMVEIAAAKTKRNIKLAAMDAEIAALEAELAASKTKPNALET
jgi:hypothetical protein